MATPQIASTLFVIAVLASSIAPQTRIITIVGMAVLILGWIGLELLPTIGVYGGNSSGIELAFCTVVIAVPALWLGIRRTLSLYNDDSSTFSRFGIVLLIGGAAYLLPYMVAVPVKRLPLFHGIGCLDIGCGALGAPPFDVYMLGTTPAAYFSIAGALITIVLGRLALRRSLMFIEGDWQA
jgi:hypothetical protein